MRYTWAWLRWVFFVISYRIRPFDPSHDERRWFWQRPHHCCYVIDIRDEAEWNE